VTGRRSAAKLLTRDEARRDSGQFGGQTIEDTTRRQIKRIGTPLARQQTAVSVVK